MSKIVIQTLCFNRPETVREACEKLKITQDLKSIDAEHVLVDVGYPLPNKHDNSIRLAEIAKEFNCTLIKPYKNRSVAQNWTWTAKELELSDDDILIGMDPDSWPLEMNWCKAVADVLRTDKTAAYISLRRVSGPGLSTESDESNRPYSHIDIAGYKLRKYHQLIAWPMGGFNVGFILDGGLKEQRPYYGYIEHESSIEMYSRGLSWYVLEDYTDATCDRGEQLYRNWKVKHAGNHTDLSFEDWLKENGVI